MYMVGRRERAASIRRRILDFFPFNSKRLRFCFCFYCGGSAPPRSSYTKLIQFRYKLERNYFTFVMFIIIKSVHIRASLYFILRKQYLF